MTYLSDPASTLVLVAFDAADACDWQREYPELAGAVRTVILGDRATLPQGMGVTAAYVTSASMTHWRFKFVVANLWLIAQRQPQDDGRFVRASLDAGVMA